MNYKFFTRTVVCSAAALLCFSCSKKEQTADDSASDIVVEETVEEPEPFVGCLPNGIYKGTGDFNGKYPITLMIAVDGNKAAGYYYYNKYKSPILLTGIVGPTFLTLQEYTDGENTGDFYGMVEDQETFSGQFTNHSTDKKLSYEVKFQLVDTSTEGSQRLFSEVEGLDPEGSYQYSAPESSSSSSSFGGSGDASYDEYLDRLESYYDRLSKIAPALSRGDASKLIEYQQLLVDYSDLAESLQNISGEMSMAQLNRFNKISAKIAEISQKFAM